MSSCVATTGHNQWRSQNEQVAWTQHGHTQCVHDMHLLGNLGHAPAMKMFKLYTLKLLLRPFSVTNTIHSVLPVRSLHVHMKLTIAHTNT